MPERAQHIPPPPPLDEQVDQLLADAAANDEAVRNAGPDESVEVGDDFASPDELLSDVNASMESLHAQAESAAGAEVEQLSAVAESASAPGQGAAPQEEDTDFASPQVIQELDERLAASAQELTEHAGGQASPVEQVDPPGASGVSGAPAASASGVDAGAVAADTQADAGLGADVQAAPGKAAASARADAPGAAHAMPGSGAAAPAPSPAVEKVIPVQPAAPAPIAARRRQYHVGAMMGSLAAAIVRPIADYTSGLSPTVRQTIGYAAIITIFQAACLWGFLIFRGPPSEPAPTGEGAVLRRVGDDAEHAARQKAVSAHAKPASKTAAKTDSKAKAGKKDSQGGH